MRRILRLLQWNWKSFVLFELSFKAMAAACFALLFNFAFDLSMNAMGVSYLTPENFKVLALMLLRTFQKEELYMLPKGKNIVTILEKLHLIR